MAYSKNEYTINSMYRDTGAHNGMGVDMRYRPGSDDLDDFFLAVTKNKFEPSDPEGLPGGDYFKLFEIEGTNLAVSRHDNDDGSGNQHYHIFHKDWKDYE